MRTGMKVHPPIPSNCPYFEKATNGTDEYVFWAMPGPWPKEAAGEMGIPMYHEPSIGGWRKMIAIVAEHYWRIDADSWFQMSLFSDPKKIEKDCLLKHNDSIKNTVLWREWGDKVVKEDEKNG